MSLFVFKLQQIGFLVKVVPTATAEVKLQYEKKKICFLAKRTFHNFSVNSNTQFWNYASGFFFMKMSLFIFKKQQIGSFDEKKISILAFFFSDKNLIEQISSIQDSQIQDWLLDVMSSLIDKGGLNFGSTVLIWLKNWGKSVLSTFWLEWDNIGNPLWNQATFINSELMFV